MKLTLKRWRGAAGLTQKEAAKRIGVSEQTLLSWEKGRTYPTVDLIPAIEEAYSLKWEDVIIMP